MIRGVAAGATAVIANIKNPAVTRQRETRIAFPPVGQNFYEGFGRILFHRRGMRPAVPHLHPQSR